MIDERAPLGIVRLFYDDRRRINHRGELRRVVCILDRLQAFVAASAFFLWMTLSAVATNAQSGFSSRARTACASASSKRSSETSTRIMLSRACIKYLEGDESSVRSRDEKRETVLRRGARTAATRERAGRQPWLLLCGPSCRMPHRERSAAWGHTSAATARELSELSQTPLLRNTVRQRKSRF